MDEKVIEPAKPFAPTPEPQRPSAPISNAEHPAKVRAQPGQPEPITPPWAVSIEAAAEHYRQAAGRVHMGNDAVMAAAKIVSLSSDEEMKAQCVRFADLSGYPTADFERVVEQLRAIGRGE